MISRERKRRLVGVAVACTCGTRLFLGSPLDLRSLAGAEIDLSIWKLLQASKLGTFIQCLRPGYTYIGTTGRRC